MRSRRNDDGGFGDLDDFLADIRQLPTLNDDAAGVAKVKKRRWIARKKQKRVYPAENRVAGLYTDQATAQLFERYRDAFDLAYNAGLAFTIETYNNSPASNRRFANQTEMRRHARALLPECRNTPSTIIDSAVNEVFLALRNYNALKATNKHVPFPKERRRLRQTGRHFSCKQVVVNHKYRRILVPQARCLKQEHNIWVHYEGDVAPGDRQRATFIQRGSHWIVVTRDRTT